MSLDPYPDAGIAVGLRDSNIGVPLDDRRLRLAETGEVLHVIVHVLDGERQDLDAHAAHVRSRHLAHQTRELVSVLVYLFYCKSSWETKE